MAKYELNSRVFIAGQLLDPGFIVTLPDDFRPGRAYTPLDEAAETAYGKYQESLPNSLKPKAAPEPLKILIEEQGPDTTSKEVNLSETLAGSLTENAKPSLSEAKATPVAPTK